VTIAKILPSGFTPAVLFVFDEFAVLFFAFSQCLFDALALGNLQRNLDFTAELAGEALDGWASLASAGAGYRG